MKKIALSLKTDVWGLFWLGSGLFLALALSSYHPEDPSINSLGKKMMAQNICGILGSFLSDLLLQTFGAAAWAFVFFSIFTGARILISEGAQRPLRWQFLHLFLHAALLASILGLHFSQIKIYFDHIYLGGLVGKLVSLGTVKLINSGGAAVVLWTTWLVLLVATTEFRVKDIVSLFVGWLQTAITWLEVPEKKKKASKEVQIPDVERKFFPVQPEEQLSFVEEMDEEDDVGERIMDEEDTPSKGPKLGGFFLKQEKQKKKIKVPQKIRRIENWELPKLSLIEDAPAQRAKLDEKEIKARAKVLVDKLAQFDITGEVVGIKPGPAVTLFEFKPAADVKISRITELADDLSLALSSESVRIIAPIPGRDVVGIETANQQRDPVYLKEIIAQDSFWDEETKLPIALGRKADGEPRLVDLRKMPHLLVAGSTGSGKSVFVVSMITGLLFRHSPKTLKMILVDPKQVDLAAFEDLPHLIMPPIRDPRKAVGALRYAIKEMEKRYRSMSRFGARGLESYNEMMAELTKEQIEEHTKFHEDKEGSFHPESYYFQQLPYIVIVVEEFGDLMAVDRLNVEQAVVRLAQMARACGIHLVLAMQSPRKDVVTGLIKTNIPGRISFKVASKMDSRIILDEAGAERLLARGDMLFLAPSVGKPERHHGPYLSEKEITAVMEAWKIQGEPEYDPIAIRAVEGNPEGEGGSLSTNEFGDDIKDEKYDEVLAWVAAQREVSASLLQRRFRLGYPRAARIIEIFEQEGVVGPANGSKPRQVLIREAR